MSDVVSRLLAAIDHDRAHVARHDPASVLRLCQAHRDIVAEYERARADYDDASLKQGRSVAIWPAEIADLEQRVMVTLARLQALEIGLCFLARGYGVEDGEY